MNILWADSTILLARLDYCVDFIFRDLDHKSISSFLEFHPSRNKQMDSQWFSISWIFLGNQT